jgi:hypothetical protein
MSSRRAVFLAALLGVTACGGGSDLSAPLSGPLDLVLQTPADDDGIVLVELVGGTVDSVTALGYRTEASSVGTAPLRIVVSGALEDGKLVRIWVPDRTRASDYTASVVEAAARGTYLLQDVAEYGIDVTGTAP